MSGDPGEVLQEREDRPVIKVGDAVRHLRQPWSASVQALLGYLHQVGFTEAPVPGALTEDYEDVSFIEGISGDEACRMVATDKAVAAVAQLLRRYHDLVEDWHPETEPVWFDGQRGTGDPGWEYAIVGTCHEDIPEARRASRSRTRRESTDNGDRRDISDVSSRQPAASHWTGV